MKEKKSDHRKHISNTLEDSEKDPRKFWRTIKKNLQSNVLVQHTVITEKRFDHFHQVFNGDIVNDTDVDAADEPLFQQLSRDKSSHSPSMSRVTTASPELFFGTPWGFDDTAVSRENVR